MHCSRELREILIALADPHGEVPDMAKLAEILSNDPEALAYYVEFMDVHARLGHVHAESLSMPDPLYNEADWLSGDGGIKAAEGARQSSPASTRDRSAWWSRVGVVGSLAAAVCLGFVWFVAVQDDMKQAEVGRVVVQPAPAILDSHDAARIVRLSECQWDGKPMEVDDYVMPGGSVNLVHGVVELQLADGANVVVEGPTSFVVEASDTAFLGMGRITCNALSGLDGFTVRTPVATIVNLGAEFGVSVESDGATESHVARGTVGFQPIEGNDSGEVLVISQQEGARLVNADEAKPVVIDYHPSQLKRFPVIETVVAAHPTSGVVRSHGQGMLFGGYMQRPTQRRTFAAGARRIGTSSISIPKRFNDEGPVGLANVCLFRLPAIADADSVSSVEFEFTFRGILGEPSYNVDLYGLGYFDLRSPRRDWYYAGTEDTKRASDYGLKGNSQVELLVEDLLTPETKSGRMTIGGDRLLGFMRSVYRNGAKEGDLVVLRLSPNTDLEGESHATGYMVIYPPEIANWTTESQMPVLKVSTSAREFGVALHAFPGVPSLPLYTSFLKDRYLAN